MAVDVRGVKGWAELQAAMKDFSERRAAAAMATAMTRTVKALQTTWTKELGDKLDKPTPATLKSVVVRGATAQSLQASVLVRDQVASGGLAPAGWLLPSERGGDRLVKKFERALMAQGAMPAGTKVVPGKGATLDGYGNVSRAQIVQVIAQLGKDFSPGYARVISKSTEKRVAKAAKTGRAYVALPTGSGAGNGKLAPGIYQRSGRGLVPVFLFVKAVQYPRRLDLVQVANAAALDLFPREAQLAVAQSATRLAARTAKGRP